MKNSVSFDKNIKKIIKKSVKTLSKAVKGTLGPSGTNVMVLSPIKLPIITNDGVTVIKSFVTSLTEKYPDSLETKISQLLKTVSDNTEKFAGDGTTTSFTLLESIILEGLKYVESGFSPIDISKGIFEATKQVMNRLDEISIPVEENEKLLQKISTISANNDQELGKIIAEAFLKVGVDGQIEIENSKTKKTYIDFVNGMRYFSGYESNMFVNSDKGLVKLNDCNIFIYEGKLKELTDMKNILQNCANEEESLLIIADDYGSGVIDALCNLKINNKMKICAVKSPGYGLKKETDLEDIALVTNSTIISNRFGLDISESDLEHLGKANITIDKDSFTILSEDSKEELLQNKILVLKESLKDLDDNEKNETLERISRLSNGVAIMYVGGDSPIEIAEKNYRAEDALNATKCALEEGILPGGGIALLKLSKSLKMPEMENESQEIGFKVLQKALEAPIRTLAENGEQNGDVIINKILENENFNFGYNAKTEKYGDLIEQGVLDAKKVTKTALMNASSVSQMMLTLNCAIY